MISGSDDWQEWVAVLLSVAVALMGVLFLWIGA